MDPKASRSKAAAARAAPRLSAIVVTRQAGAALEFCLSSLLSDQSVDELVIVDNGEQPEVASALRALSADRRDVRLVQGHGEASLAQALNLAVAEARGRWLLFVHPEVVVQPGAVDRLLKAGRLARAPAAVGGSVAGRPARRAPRHSNGPHAVEALSGELVLVGRVDLARVEGFRLDSNAPFVDLARRLAAAGGEVLVQPAAAGVQVRPQRSVAGGFSARLFSLLAWLGLRRRRL